MFGFFSWCAFGWHTGKQYLRWTRGEVIFVKFSAVGQPITIDNVALLPSAIAFVLALYFILFYFPPVCNCRWSALPSSGGGVDLYCWAQVWQQGKSRPSCCAESRVAVLSPKTLVLRTSGLSAWRLWYFFFPISVIYGGKHRNTLQRQCVCEILTFTP